MPNLVVIRKTGMFSGSTREYWPKVKAIKKVVIQLKKITGIEIFNEERNGIKVHLIPGYSWEEVEPQILDTIQATFRWEMMEVVDYWDWQKKLNQEQGKVDEDDKPINSATTENGIVIITDKTNLKYTEISFAPPWVITRHSESFTVPLTEVQNESVTKIEEDVLSLIFKVSMITGIFWIQVEGFYLTIKVSPAFDTKPIIEEIERMIIKPEN